MGQTEVKINTDKNFIDMAINSILGMIMEKEFSDVFQTLKMNPELANGPKPSFTTIQASAAVYHILFALFRGNDQFVKDVAHMLLAVIDHEVIETHKESKQ